MSTFSYEDATGHEVVLVHTHSQQACAGRPCVIHAPTEHLMANFPLHWRTDRAIFERICPHGVGHPDPDQFEYWRENDLMSEAVHGCDGCCGEGL